MVPTPRGRPILRTLILKSRPLECLPVLVPTTSAVVLSMMTARCMPVSHPHGVLCIPCHLGIINVCSCHRLGMVLQARERMGVTCTIHLSPLALLIPQLWMYEISLAIYHDHYITME